MPKNVITNNKYGGKFWTMLSESSRKGLIEVLTETIQEVEADAKNGCPEDEGDLKASIYSGVKVKDDGVIAFCKAHEKYGFSVEYGHGTAEPKPYLRPALDKNKRKVADRWKVELK